MEESVIVTVEETEFPPKCNTCSNSGGGIKRLDHLFEIRLLGHCIFCLRKVRKGGAKGKGRKRKCEDKNGEEDAVEAVVPSDLLETFQRLWQFVQCKLKRGRKEEFDKFILESLVGEGNQKIRFSDVPTLCQSCADKLFELEGLLDSIRDQLGEICEITKESRRGGLQFSGRGQKFENQLRNEALVDTRIVDSTLEFLYGLDGAGVEKREEPLSPSIIHEPEVATTLLAVNTENYPIEDPLASVSIPIPVKEESNIEIEVNCVKAEIDAEGGSDMDDDPDYMQDEPDTDDEGEDGSNYEDDEYEPEISEEEPEEPPKAKKRKSSNRKKDPLEQSPSSSKSSGGTNKPESAADSTKRSKCDFPGCDKDYVKSSHMRRHQARAHPEYAKQRKSNPQPRPSRIQTQYCDLCATYIPISEAMEHVRGHVGDYALKCPYTPTCPFVASNPGSLKFHIPRSRKCLAVHSKKNRELYSKCETCGFTTNYIQTLRAHITNEHERSDINDFKCPLPNCTVGFGSRQSVWFHMESHSIIPGVKQKCQHCKLRLPDGEMEEHLKSTHDVKEVVKCKQCPYAFSSRITLLDHLYTHRITGMTCDICDNGIYFTRHHDIRKHYLSVHEIDVPRHVCEHCGCVFWRYSAYQGHLRDKHPSTGVIPANVVERHERRMKRVKCDLCFNDVDFCGKDTLINHKILVHGADPYTCKTCGEKFNTGKRYVRHVKIHLGIKFQTEFKCDVEGCGAVYKQKHRMLEHKTRVHEGKKNHVCDICGKCMFDINTLKRHREAIHFGIRRFVCELCGKGFVERRKLDAHKKRMDHKEYFANKD